MLVIIGISEFTERFDLIGFRDVLVLGSAILPQASPVSSASFSHARAAWLSVAHRQSKDITTSLVMTGLPSIARRPSASPLQLHHPNVSVELSGGITPPAGLQNRACYFRNTRLLS
jgi:hypothetical protein